MRIAIDCDSVQSKFQELWCERYNKRYNDNFNTNNILSWNIEKYLTKCTKNELYQILQEDNFFLNVEPRNSARKVIDKLRSYGHEVFTVTAYSPFSCVDKSTWLIEKMGFMQDDIIFCNEKHRILADFLIDDGIHNLSKFKGCKILFDQSHNKHEPDYLYDIRVKDWDQIECYFKMNELL